MQSTWSISTESIINMHFPQVFVMTAAILSVPLLALPSRRKANSCDSYVAGLTVWSDADFSGTSHQYNVSWNTCSTQRQLIPYHDHESFHDS